MLKDPVMDFVYPDTWVRRCRDKDALARVAEGRAVLTSSGSVLYRGISTGTVAAAACKAAVLSLKEWTDQVDVRIPCGLLVSVPVNVDGGRASAWKDAGDYRDDVTDGLEFVAHATPEGIGVRLTAGTGIGRYVRDTPRFRRGAAAISATASASIHDAIGEAMETTGLAGVHVRLHVHRGEEVARETLNPKVGIEGGISVLGSTGLVEPWDDHLAESAYERIAGAERVVLTTGRLGLRYSRLLFPGHEVVLVGVNLKKGIEHASGKVILCGLPALILKFLNPRILDGTEYATVEDLSGSPCWQEILQRELSAYKERFPGVRVVIVDRNGRVAGDSG
jgi:cobalt-precorrin-5B (C1)-methyltransferase